MNSLNEHKVYQILKGRMLKDDKCAKDVVGVGLQNLIAGEAKLITKYNGALRRLWKWRNMNPVTLTIPQEPSELAAHPSTPQPGPPTSETSATPSMVLAEVVDDVQSQRNWMKLSRSFMIWKERWLKRLCPAWQRTTLHMTWMRFLLKMILILIQTNWIWVMKVIVTYIGRKRMDSDAEYVAVVWISWNLAKSDMTSVTSTKLNPFCPAFSECSLAEFERKDWSQSYCVPSKNEQVVTLAK